jgi:hypothetical protein
VPNLGPHAHGARIPSRSLRCTSPHGWCCCCHVPVIAGRQHSHGACVAASPWRRALSASDARRRAVTPTPLCLQLFVTHSHLTSMYAETKVASSVLVGEMKVRFLWSWLQMRPLGKDIRSTLCTCACAVAAPPSSESCTRRPAHSRSRCSWSSAVPAIQPPPALCLQTTSSASQTRARAPAWFCTSKT